MNQNGVDFVNFERSLWVSDLINGIIRFQKHPFKVESNAVLRIYLEKEILANTVDEKKRFDLATAIEKSK